MNRSKKSSFPELLDFAHELARLSGEAILPFYRRPIEVENKNAEAAGSGFDPVTAADRAAEDVMRKALAARYPDHAIIGEEYGRRAGSEGGYSWIIDPIDGTRSFVMGFPTWGTLIGLSHEDKPLIGIMNQPFTGERFFSTEGASLYRGHGEERELKTRPCARLEDAVVACTHPDLFREEGELERFLEVKAAARMTRYGGDCYAYCMVAAGLIDAVVEAGLQVYDVAALVPIIERAGGRMTSWDGGRGDQGGRIIASGDPRLHDRLVKMLGR